MFATSLSKGTMPTLKEVMPTLNGTTPMLNGVMPMLKGMTAILKVVMPTRKEVMPINHFKAFILIFTLNETNKAYNSFGFIGLFCESHVYSGTANYSMFFPSYTYPYIETKNRFYFNVTAGFKFGYRRALHTK